MKKYFGAVIAVMILAIVILGTISALGLFGGAIMMLFGFKYTSIWMVILFFIIASFISYPISLFAEALPNVLYIEFGKLTLLQAQILFLILDTISTAIGMVLVDLFMKSVSAPDIAILIVSFIFALMGVKDIGKKKATTILK